MMKYAIGLLWGLWSICGFAHDELYYTLNPNKLEKVIASCPSSATDISCQALTKIARHVNELAYELRLDPQGFGQKILLLQEQMASKQDTQSTLGHTTRELQERLAIVKWLESPES